MIKLGPSVITLPRDLAAEAILTLQDSFQDGRSLEVATRRMAIRLILRPYDLAMAAIRDARITKEEFDIHEAPPSSLDNAADRDRLQRILARNVNLIARLAISKAAIYISMLGLLLTVGAGFYGNTALQAVSWIPIALSMLLSLRHKIGLRRASS